MLNPILADEGENDISLYVGTFDVIGTLLGAVGLLLEGLGQRDQETET